MSDITLSDITLSKLTKAELIERVRALEASQKPTRQPVPWALVRDARGVYGVVFRPLDEDEDVCVAYPSERDYDYVRASCLTYVCTINPEALAVEHNK